MFLLGASYFHKNRVFAIRLLHELRHRGWDGRLVLAGPTPPRGTSLGEEAAMLLRHPSLKPHVVQLGNLSEDEKRWMYSRCALSLYPTVSEGFGLVPFESARRDVPVLSSRQGSLDEVLPADLETLGGYDVSAAADLALNLMTDASAARRNRDLINERADTFTWDNTAAAALSLIDEVLTRAPKRLASAWGEAGIPAVLDAGSTSHLTGRQWICPGRTGDPADAAGRGDEAGGHPDRLSSSGRGAPHGELGSPQVELLTHRFKNRRNRPA